jgi:serine/threonine protein kinase
MRGAQESHETVAIKTIKRDGLSSKLLDNLKSEIDILKSLSHRHITKLLDIVVRTLPFAAYAPAGLTYE